jgi:hypothetical protein
LPSRFPRLDRKPLIDRVLGAFKEVLRTRGQLVFPSYHQKSVRKDGLVEATGDLLLDRLGEVSICQIATEDEVVSRDGRIPQEVVLHPENPVQASGRDDKISPVLDKVPAAKLKRQLSEAARRVTALTGTVQAAAVRITCHEQELVV